MNNSAKLKVYYNSACPVCEAGIEWQKGKSSLCQVEWGDVHVQNQLVEEINADLEFVRKRLHLVDENNELQVGFNAFLTIWRNSPNEQWKATIFGLPFIKQGCNLAYNVFAEGLYQWNRAKKHW